MSDQRARISSDRYWDDKHPKAEITYAGRPLPGRGENYKMDVRRFIWADDVVLWKWLERAEGVTQANNVGGDVLARAVQSYIRAAITYTSDSTVTTGTPEFWQFPVETVKRMRGDCEDGAILIVSILRMLGIPAGRIRVAAGMVLDQRGGLGGHAWACYRRYTDEEWIPLDWCYHADSHVEIATRKPLRERAEYQHGNDIWFSFNDYFAWSHKRTQSVSGRVRTSL